MDKKLLLNAGLDVMMVGCGVACGVACGMCINEYRNRKKRIAMTKEQRVEFMKEYDTLVIASNIVNKYSKDCEQKDEEC